jgi:hypothetical protein
MDLQQQLIDAIRQELQRQAAVSQGRLKADFSSPTEETAVVQGPVDLAALAMVVTGAVAGGP